MTNPNKLSNWYESWEWCTLKWCIDSARCSVPWFCYFLSLIMEESELSANTTAWASESSLILEHWGNNFDVSLLSATSQIQEYVLAGDLMAKECGVCHCAASTHSSWSSRSIINYAVTMLQYHHVPCPVWDAAWMQWNIAGLQWSKEDRPIMCLIRSSKSPVPLSFHKWIHILSLVDRNSFPLFWLHLS